MNEGRVEDEDYGKEEEAAEEIQSSSGEEGGENKIWGLQSDMKLKTLTSKKARRRFKKKMMKEKEEEDTLKDKLKKLHEQQ